MLDEHQDTARLLDIANQRGKGETEGYYVMGMTRRVALSGPEIARHVTSGSMHQPVCLLCLGSCV